MKKVISLLSILTADITALIITFHAAYFIRVEIIQQLFHLSNPWFFPIDHFYKMYYLLLVFILIFSYEKLYSKRYDFFQEWVFIARGLFISVILIALLVYLSRTYETFTRSIPILMMLIGMVTVPVFRLSIKKILKILGLYTKHVVVVGNEQSTRAVMPSLEKLQSTGLRIKSTLDPTKYTFSQLVDTIAHTCEHDKVESLVIISRGLEARMLDKLINHCENHVKEIKIVSDSSYLKTIGVETEHVDELLVMRMANNLLSPINRLLKRLFDLVTSTLSTLVMLPFFLLIAVAIKLDSRGPVLFVQERFGKKGNRFRLFKFRSMYVNADEKLKEYLDHNPTAQEEWQQYKKLKSFDPRITRVGKFLRRFSLDESPQIFNILKGDMSIVGPRPYLIREKQEIQRSAAIIFRVKSGLTGLWQIKGRNDLDFETRLKLDEFYVRNWSFFLDITIILKTFGAVIKGKGAY